jgi:hypothetical protein
MNLRRGFHRVFMVLWVLYVAALLFYPFYSAQVEMRQVFKFEAARYVRCMEERSQHYPGSSVDDNYNFCEAERKERIKDVGFWMDWIGLWQILGWHLLWFVPVVIVVLPLIVYGMLYPVIWLVVKTSRWVVEGFRESTS